jgi:RNA recognition motif-containing protein
LSSFLHFIYILILIFTMNIFVAKLNFKTTSEDLQALFEQFGAVTSAKVVTDQETGKSRGFGFVEMSSDEDAAKAMSELDGAEFQTRTIVVKEATPQAPRQGGGGFNNNRGGGGGFNNNRGGGGGYSNNRY